MTHLDFPQQSRVTNEKEAKELVARESEKALQSSATVGDYTEKVRERIDNIAYPNKKSVNAVQSDTQAKTQKLLQKEAKAIEKATADHKDLAFDTSLKKTNVLGYANVGGGEGTVRLNPTLAMDLSNPEGVEQLTNVAAHELAHAKDQKVMGDIFTNEKVTGWELNELHSEQAGALATGKGIHDQRPNQPQDYAKAQSRGRELERHGVSKSEFDSYIKEGNTHGLQKKIINNGIDKGTVTPEDMQRGIEEMGYPYKRALLEVIEERTALAAH